MKRALVLGGGGPIGIAWHCGLAIGLREEGIELRDADIIVGTSAGSLVGTRLAAGQDLAEPTPGAQPLGLPFAEGGPDTAAPPGGGSEDVPIARNTALWH